MKKNKLVALLYIFTYLPLLLLPGLFWDDWIYYFQDDRGKVLWELGRPYMELFFFIGEVAIDPLSVSRSLIVLLFGLSCYYVFKWVKLVAPDFFVNNKVILLLLLLTPINYARTHNIILHYFLCQFLFVLSHYEILKNEVNKENIYKSYLYSIALFFSFTTNSFLFFHYFVLLFGYYAVNGNSFTKLIGRLKSFKGVYFLLLPIVFYICNKLFFAPYGSYANYNQISLLNVPRAGLETVKLIFKSLTYPFLWNPFNYIEFWLILVLLIVFFQKLNLFKSILKVKKYKIQYVALICFIAMFFSLFPYSLVNAYPTAAGWASRHLMVSMVVIPIVIYSLVNFLPFFKGIFLSLLIAFFISKNWVRYSEALYDSQIQEITISLFKQSDEVKKADLIILDEKHRPFLSIDRLSSFYEVSHYLNKAYNDGARFGINAVTAGYSKDRNVWLNAVSKYHNNYSNYGSYNFENKKNINILYLEYQSSLKEWTVLPAYFNLFYKLYDRDVYMHKIKNKLKFKKTSL